MKDKIQSLIAMLIVGALVLGFFYLILQWEIYKYNDCRKVGHTKIYCLFTKN